MAKKNLNKEFAQTLYMQGSSIKSIAERIGVTEQSVYKWKKAGEWEQLKAVQTITKKEELTRLYRQLSELNNLIESREKGQRFANTKEADIIGKLGAAIRQLEVDSSIAQIIDSCIELTEFMQDENEDNTSAFVELTDRFITKKLAQQ